MRDADATRKAAYEVAVQRRDRRLDQALGMFDDMFNAFQRELRATVNAYFKELDLADAAYARAVSRRRRRK